MQIDQPPDPDYEAVGIGYIGLADPHAREGISILRANDGREFHMRAFSGEVAGFISAYASGEEVPVPSIYRMIQEICEMSGLVLVKVKIYESGEALRANLYFKGRSEIILRNYRASDALALAACHGVPILVRSTLLRDMKSD
ncbi:MAG: bifunctional nuclease family protein [Thaumarchaeota archaeon]|nr:bifunctional nuclease family protein [Nitrososphaerota archaeon]